MVNKGSFIRNNLGGLIFSIVLVVFADIVMASTVEYGAGKYIALSILHIPVVFIAWVIVILLYSTYNTRYTIMYGIRQEI
jgi:hypothetical protein